MKRVILPFSFFLLVTLACNVISIPFRPTPTATSSFDPARLGGVESDVTYCEVEGVELKMDLHFPDEDDGPWPVTVYVHGGAWSGGDKTGGAGFYDVTELVARGYLVVCLNYRLAPEYKFPAQIEDVKCAIRHLRAHAADYNLDPERIGAWGGSAGGHLVSLLGLTDPSAGFDSSGEYPDQSSRVKAVVDLFGPANLCRDFAIQQVLNPVFGATSRRDSILIHASPITHASPDDPPFLIFHGEADEVVPLGQSQTLYESLIAVGVPATLVIVENAGHGFRPIGGEINPSRPEISCMIADFFDEHLR